MLISAVSRFTAFAELTESDFEDLSRLASGRRSVGRGEFICREGEDFGGLVLLLQGWVASSIHFADGARQLLNVHLPGDMLGTADLALGRCSQSIMAITPVELGLLSRHELGRLFENNPRLAALLFLISQEERVVLMDRLAAIGATEAPSRLATMLLHVHARLLRSDPETGPSFNIPLSQEHLAELIGVSTTHLNRTLRLLRSQKLVDWKPGRVTILDEQGLVALSGLPPRVLERNANWLPRTRS